MADSHEPATKADLEGLEARLKTDIENLDVRVDTRFHEFEHRMEDLIKDSETRLLKAFYGFAESNYKRLSEAERENGSLKERLGILEERVTDLEKRLNMPPPA